MSILEEAAALARAFVSAEQADDAVLLRCCKAAEAELLSSLRPGLSEEDCRDSFVCACAWLAMSYLCAGRSAGPEQFTVGDVSIRQGGELGAQCLRAQARLALAPYWKDEAFAFKGVKA